MARPPNSRLVFRFLLFYRWVSLVPPLLFTFVNDWPADLSLAFWAAISLNLILALFANQINHFLQQHPAMLLLDLGFMAGLMALSGGWQSPYYLYALNPLLAAAFFFGLRGALLASTLFTPLYWLIGWLEGSSPAGITTITAITGFYLLSGSLGYAANLLNQLQETQKNLSQAHHNLIVTHQLLTSLHAAATVEEVQEKVLDGLTSQLHCQTAVIGLVENGQWLTGWLGNGTTNAPTLAKKWPHPARIPLTPEGGLVAQTVLNGQPCLAAPQHCATHPWLKEQFGLSACLILPLTWGKQPIGVLLVNSHTRDEAQLSLLETIASQTAVVIGMMQTRIRRARESAVQEERARIAQDLHDSVSQALFGIVYALDGSLKLLPKEPAAVAPELSWALETAESLRQEIRHLIQDLWPAETSPDRFEADLRRYATDVLQATGLTFYFDIRGDFSAMSPKVRRSLYRISQEALANVVHHAAANEARVCVDVSQGWARLAIRDDGRGFEPTVALNLEKEHFGLRGMQERVQALGGSCDIFSRPAAGTSIVIDVPAG